MNMTVSKLARETGVNLETVRFYEKQRLLPKPERTMGGHRLYSGEDVQRLRFILRAKSVGFTLKEIAVLSRLREEDPGASCDDAMDLARRKIDEIDAKLHDLREMRKALKGFVDACPEQDLAHCHVMQGLDANS
jgi:DNA-binding transcriptional MerR regulator